MSNNQFANYSFFTREFYIDYWILVILDFKIQNVCNFRKKYRLPVTSEEVVRHIIRKRSEKQMTVNEYNKSVELFSDRVYRFILKSIRDIHKAEDIVQDSYEKLWKNFENVSFEKVKSYLFTTAYHTMIDIIRKEKRSSYSEELNLPEQSHENNYTDLGDILKEAVDKLPEVQRMVLLLRDYEGYSYEEIGEMANLNESQVKVYIYRARVFLKKYIGRMEAVV
jgi:RNA polymerase sigma-70 factor (ECF subfamily)